MLATLRNLGACRDAMNWAERRRHTSVAAAWNECEQAHWLVWYALAVGVPPPQVTVAAARCVGEALHLAREELSHSAWEATRHWAAGSFSSEDCVAIARATRRAYFEDASSTVVTRAAYLLASVDKHKSGSQEILSGAVACAAIAFGAQYLTVSAHHADMIREHLPARRIQQTLC